MYVPLRTYILAPCKPYPRTLYDWLRGARRDIDNDQGSRRLNTERAHKYGSLGPRGVGDGNDGIRTIHDPVLVKTVRRIRAKTKDVHSASLFASCRQNVCIHVFHPELDAEAHPGPPHRAAGQETRSSEARRLAKPPGCAHSRACAGATVRQRVEEDDGLRCRPGEGGEMPRKSARLAMFDIKSSCAALLEKTLSLHSMYERRRRTKIYPTQCQTIP